MKVVQLIGGIAAVITILSLLTAAEAAGDRTEKGSIRVYATLDRFEIDKCATIWLIRRFIDPGAVIEVRQEDDGDPDVIWFDTPGGRFRRTHNRSTFESLLEHQGIDDPRLVHIGRIIHDIEINTWERKRYSETTAVRDAVNRIILDTRDSQELIKKTGAWFDRFYQP